MILNDSILENRLFQLFDFDKSSTNRLSVLHQINPNSIDLTLDRYIMRMKDLLWLNYGSENQDCWNFEYNEDDCLILYPDDCVLCCTREYIIMPNDLCGQLFTKSTLGRMFVNHMMAGVIDAGFEGKITLELKNDSKNIICIPFGSRVVQIVYSKLYEEAKQPYNKRNNRYNYAEYCEPPKKEVI